MSVGVEIAGAAKDSLGQFRVIPIQSSEPQMKVGIIVSDALQIRLEEGVVSRIETDQSRKEADVRFGDVLAEEEWLMIRRGQMGLQAV